MMVRRRPLNRLLTTSSLEEMKKPKVNMNSIKMKKQKVNMNSIKKINNEILQLQLKVNTIIDRYIVLIKSNASNHKQFLLKKELEEAQDNLNILIKKKKIVIVNILNTL